MNAPIETAITDQQVARRSKVPLKILRQHPDYMEGFRKYLAIQAKGDADAKKSKELMRLAKSNRDSEALAEAIKLSSSAAEACLTAASMLWDLPRPVEGCV